MTESLIAVGCCQAKASAHGTVDTTWTWDGSVWTQQVLPTNPPAVGSGLALDPALGRLVLCSCDVAAAPEPEVWSWSGSRWEPMRVERVPVEPAMAVAAPDFRQLLILGSLTQGTQPIHVWSLTGSRWRRLD